jgi:hypothetical protein
MNPEILPQRMKLISTPRGLSWMNHHQSLIAVMQTSGIERASLAPLKDSMVTLQVPFAILSPRPKI